MSVCGCCRARRKASTSTPISRSDGFGHTPHLTGRTLVTAFSGLSATPMMSVSMTLRHSRTWRLAHFLRALARHVLGALLSFLLGFTIFEPLATVCHFLAPFFLVWSQMVTLALEPGPLTLNHHPCPEAVAGLVEDTWT